MIRSITTVCFIFVLNTALLAQTEQVSIHQEQLEYYNSLGYDATYYQQHNEPSVSVNHPKNNCSLDKYVFGWHPFWSNGLEVNYNWNLLSDLSYFSYEVDPNTGDALTTHSFSTAPVVTEALNNGVRVNLCVTLFSNHATLLGNAAARQNLISNLISLVQNRGAHGVNIDFESMSSSVSADYTSFMIDLCTQMHAQIPGSQVSIAMHAVDWSGFYDIPALAPYVDLFCIMGYDYYWTGSANAGPNDPLFHFQNTYNYTLSRSTTYYLDKGVPKDKLILGLPYYGREWNVSTHNLPAPTTANGTAVFYRTVKNNASGNYAQANRNIEQESRSVYYNYTDGSTPVQCFISEEEQLGERMDFINQRGLAGMGIWALGYDDGYLELWNEIEGHFTNCNEQPCSGTFGDIGGGPFKDYYNNENYTFTIAPPNAVSLDITFASFDVEQGFDYLYVYDGASVNSPQVPGSPYSGTTIPSGFSTSSGAVTFKFTSDGSTVGGGFQGSYACLTDQVDPVTTIEPSTSADWQTQDFQQGFIDEDDINGTGVHKSYYHVSYLEQGKWKGNHERGFFIDEFEGQSLHSDWNSESGSWTVTAGGALAQTDETLGNTNIWSRLNQSLSNHHVYHWKGKLSGSGNNRRAGLHIFCDDSTAINRGNSYFVWFRLDDDRVQFYKVTNDAFGSPLVNNSFDFQENVWYDFKLIYDRIDGGVWIYVDNQLVGQWNDNSPIDTGDYISFRSGNGHYEVDDIIVYRSRFPNVMINVGPDANDDIRSQNPNPSTPAGQILSLVKDSANNLSTIDQALIDVDWSPPHSFELNDGQNSGFDVDTIYNNLVLEAHANWLAIDTHSLVNEYEFTIGSQPFLDDILAWTSTGTDTFAINVTSANLVAGEWYYFSVRATNGAGLVDSISSDGFRLIPGASLENQEFSIPRLFPNPTNGVALLLSEQIIDELVVFDLNGKKLIHKLPNSKEVMMNIDRFPAGIYIVRVFLSDQVIDLRLIRE